jgi:hypothetical protein
MKPRMTPQERIRAAKELLRRAKTQPGLALAMRAELRRVAANLVACNMLEAKRNQLRDNGLLISEHSQAKYQPTT